MRVTGNPFRIDWLKYTVIKETCIHDTDTGWCHREDGHKVWPFNFDCFSTEEKAWDYLVNHAISKQEAAQSELTHRNELLKKVKREAKKRTAEKKAA